MAGQEPRPPIPTEIQLHQASRAMEIRFADGGSFRPPHECLRVYSPSAEVGGHGPGQQTLQLGKREVTIAEVEPVGHAAIRPRFADGATRRQELWPQYLGRLAAAGARRDTEPNAPTPAPGRACGHR